MTPAPPPPPPAASSASALGDPHVQNVRGEKFDLFKRGPVTLLVIPRGAALPDTTMLRVDGRAKAVGGGGICSRHYIDSLNITGSWAAAKAGTGGTSLTYTAVWEYGSPIHPQHKKVWTFGPGVRLVLGNGVTDTGVTYLNIRFQNLDKAGVPIGGLLGEDDHLWAAQQDSQCNGAATSLIAMTSEMGKEGAAGEPAGPLIMASYGGEAA